MFHDSKVDCRTEGRGETEDHTLEELQSEIDRTRTAAASRARA